MALGLRNSASKYQNSPEINLSPASNVFKPLKNRKFPYNVCPSFVPSIRVYKVTDALCVCGQVPPKPGAIDSVARLRDYVHDGQCGARAKQQGLSGGHGSEPSAHFHALDDGNAGHASDCHLGHEGAFSSAVLTLNAQFALELIALWC